MTTETLARAYFYTKLGWGNYLAWWLGAIAYITIIYELVLKALLPASPITYILIFIAIMLLSLLLGYAMRHKGIYGIEHKINTETNPYINVPIGGKDILGYQNGISALEREINNYDVQMAICSHLGLGSQLPILQKNKTLAAGLKAQLEEMLKKAVR